MHWLTNPMLHWRSTVKFCWRHGQEVTHSRHRLLSVWHIPPGFCICRPLWEERLLWVEVAIRRSGSGAKGQPVPDIWCQSQGSGRVGSSLKAVTSWRLRIWMIRLSGKSWQANASSSPLSCSAGFESGVCWTGLVRDLLLRLDVPLAVVLWQSFNFLARRDRDHMFQWKPVGLVFPFLLER